MNSQEAKEILELYRPGSADATDPAFTEALMLVGRDTDLKRWFDGHCLLYSALRDKFRGAPVPAGLKEQILAERKIHRPEFRRPVRPWLTLAAAAVVVTAVSVAIWQRPESDTSIAVFRERMTREAMSPYGMVETGSLAVMHDYFATNGAPANYSVPAGLAKATPTGCTIPNWRDSKVSMLCFKSGRPLPPGAASDVFLFVADRSMVTALPSKMTIASLGGASPVTVATWTSGDNVYVLSALGDEAFLKQYL